MGLSGFITKDFKKNSTANLAHSIQICQFGCGISKMVGPKKQDFWTKINILKGNRCILRIRGALVRQKLGMILEKKVVPKLKLENKIVIQSMVS